MVLCEQRKASSNVVLGTCCENVGVKWNGWDIKTRNRVACTQADVYKDKDEVAIVSYEQRTPKFELLHLRSCEAVGIRQ